jgi:hypothetical protein
MKKNYCLVLMILLIAGIGLTNLAVGYSPSYTPNTNYKSTYIPNPGYNSFISPTQLGTSNSLLPVQLGKANATNPDAASFSELVQEEFRIVGDSNEPIPNAQVVGLDGSGDSFQEATNNDGYVAINGASGNWQFTVYAPGYFNKLVNRKLDYSTEVMLIQLQKIVPEKINPTGNRITGNNIIANEATNKTIPNWLCESNGYSEQDSDAIPEQSIDTGAKG